MRTILPVVIGATLALCAIEAAAQTVPGDRQVALVIESKTLADALDQWAQQSGFQILLKNWDVAKKLAAPRLKGTFSAQAALEQLLSGTPLVYEFTSERTVTVRARFSVASQITGGVVSGVRRLQMAALSASEDRATRPVESGLEIRSESGKAARTGSTDERDTKELEEIVVTGTHIRGATSAGSTVQVVDRREIEASGYTTLQDVLTNTIPQNYGGAPSEDFSGNAANYNMGTGVNLRGLGADATLVLINGRRQAISGSDGSFVDVSGIPSSAVKRVELLTDGASAIYGSDAVGGVVNIILRDDYQGAESRARMGVASGGLQEVTVSQLMGTTWSSGHLLGGYQFYDRDSLARSDRAYTATADQRRFGGDDWRFGFANPGNVLDPTFSPAFAIPPNQDGMSLTPADLIPSTQNRATLQEGADLLPEVRMHSGFLTASQGLTDVVTLKAEGRYSRRETDRVLFGFPLILFVPSSNPYFVDPFGGSDTVFVEYSMGNDLGPVTASGVTDTFSGALGTELDLTHDWLARAYLSYAEEKTDWISRNNVNFAALDAALADPDPNTAFNGFGDGSHTNPGTLNAIRDTVRQHSLSDAFAINLTLDGPLAEMPAGTARFAVGLDYRSEDLSTRSSDYTGISQQTLGRNTRAAYAEVSLPLVGSRDSQQGQPSVHMSLAGRYEKYSDFGSTIDPKVGLEWRPTPGLKFRGTWGTSFKAPRLVDLHETPRSNNAFLTSFLDPTSPSGESAVLVRNGKNALLSEETATIWTAGFDVQLLGETGPTASITYFDIDYRDRILIGGPPANSSGVLAQEDQWATIVTRNPTDEQLLAICESAEFQGGDPSDCLAARPTIVDFRLQNLGTVDVQGLDVSLAHHVEGQWGSLGMQLNATKILQYKRAASEQSPGFDVVDTVGNPLAFRLRSGISWQRQAWSADAFANYSGGYTDDISSPRRRVDSWLTIDARLSFATSEWSKLPGVELALTATNILDERPPFYNFESGYDEVNADLIGRVVGVQITKIW